jgi:hypothetical protein
MAHRRNLPDEDRESELICDTYQMSILKTIVSDKDEDYDNEEQTVQRKQIRKRGLWSQADQTHVHQFTCSDRGKEKETPYINKDSSPLSALMLYFTPVIHMLVRDTNRYYHQNLDRRDGTPNPLPDIMYSEMFLFLAVIVQTGHNTCDRLRDYQTRTEQFFSPFYGNTTRDRFLHILLHYLHFTDNDTKPNMNDNNYDRPCEIRQVYDILNTVYSKFYNLSEHLAPDQVTVLSKAKVAFQQYIPKKH